MIENNPKSCRMSPRPGKNLDRCSPRIVIALAKAFPSPCPPAYNPGMPLSRVGRWGFLELAFTKRNRPADPTGRSFQSADEGSVFVGDVGHNEKQQQHGSRPNHLTIEAATKKIIAAIDGLREDAQPSAAHGTPATIWGRRSDAALCQEGVMSLRKRQSF